MSWGVQRLEGDGLQAVRNCRKISPALAAEGISGSLIGPSLGYLFHTRNHYR
jgi:hypothetical protein